MKISVTGQRNGLTYGGITCMHVLLIIPDGLHLTYKSKTHFDSVNERNLFAQMHLWLLQLVRDGQLILIRAFFNLERFFLVTFSKVNLYSDVLLLLYYDHTVCIVQHISFIIFKQQRECDGVDLVILQT